MWLGCASLDVYTVKACKHLDGHLGYVMLLTCMTDLFFCSCFFSLFFFFTLRQNQAVHGMHTVCVVKSGSSGCWAEFNYT